MHTVHWVVDCCCSNLSSGLACRSNVHCSARYKYSHKRTKITIVQTCWWYAKSGKRWEPGRWPLKSMLVFFHQRLKNRLSWVSAFYYNLYYVTRVKTAEAIEEAGMTVQMKLDWLKEESGTKTGPPYHAVLKTVASFVLSMVVDGVSKIVAEYANAASSSFAPHRGHQLLASPSSLQVDHPLSRFWGWQQRPSPCHQTAHHRQDEVFPRQVALILDSRSVFSMPLCWKLTPKNNGPTTSQKVWIA